MGKGKLLIAEDERIIALDLKTRLISFGYDVTGTAASGAEVLEQIQKQRPDLVLMDIFIKGEIDGIQTAHLLREKFGLPVIFITAHSDDTTLQRAKLAEPFGYILKPFDDRELRSVLEMAVYKAKVERRLRESETRYRAIVEDQLDLVVRFRPDLSISYANESFCSLYGMHLETVTDSHILAYLDENAAHRLGDQIAAATLNAPNLLFEASWASPQTDPRWIQWKGRVLFGDDSEVLETQLVGRDITEQNRLEESLRESNERYLLATEGANDGIWDWDLRENRIYSSTRLKELLGYSDAEAAEGPDSWYELAHPEEREALVEALNEHLDAKTPFLRHECRLRRKDGSYGWFSIRGLAVRKPNQSPHRIAGSVMDITRQKEYQDQLSFKAFHDSLTGLANRQFFLNRLQHALDRYRWPRIGLAAVLFLDLDFFKLVNDSLGHHAGDVLLISAAQRMQVSLRPGDTIARFGGDEFAILVEDIETLQDAVIVAERIQQQFLLPFWLEGKELFISASIGIADTSIPNADPDSILRNADIAMYYAKERGRGRSEIFDPSMHQAVYSHLERDRDLHQAILRNELSLSFQPVFSAAQNGITGFETMIRWHHPQQGTLLPADFLETIIENSLVAQITTWTLDAACSELSRIRAAGYLDLNVAVNLSVAQLSLAALPLLIQSSLDQYGLPAAAIEIIIGEAAAADYIRRIAPVLEKIAAMGITISIADFGYRYAFLEDLQRYGVRRVQLAQTCLVGSEPEQHRYIQRMLIGLAHIFNLEIVAEGVESAAEFARLRSEACDLFQGNWIGAALQAGEVIAFMEKQQQNPAPGR